VALASRQSKHGRDAHATWYVCFCRSPKNPGRLLRLRQTMRKDETANRKKLLGSGTAVNETIESLAAVPNEKHISNETQLFRRCGVSPSLPHERMLGRHSGSAMQARRLERDRDTANQNSVFVKFNSSKHRIEYTQIDRCPLLNDRKSSIGLVYRASQKFA